MYICKKSTRIVSMYSQVGVYLCIHDCYLHSSKGNDDWRKRTVTQSLNSVARMAETLRYRISHEFGCRIAFLFFFCSHHSHTQRVPYQTLRLLGVIILSTD